MKLGAGCFRCAAIVDTGGSVARLSAKRMLACDLRCLSGHRISPRIGVEHRGNCLTASTYLGRGISTRSSAPLDCVKDGPSVID